MSETKPAKPFLNSRFAEYAIIGLLELAVAGIIVAASYSLMNTQTSISLSPSFGGTAQATGEGTDANATGETAASGETGTQANAQAPGQTPQAVQNASNDAPPPKPIERQVMKLTGSFEDNMAKALELEKEGEFQQAFLIAEAMMETFAEHEKETRPVLQRLRAARMKAPTEAQIKNLASENQYILRDVRKAFLDAGDAGEIILRRVLRKQDGRAALNAAGILADMDAPDTMALILEELNPKLDRMISTSFARLIMRIQDRIRAEDLPRVFTMAANPEFKPPVPETLRDAGTMRANALFATEATRPQVVDLLFSTEGPAAESIAEAIEKHLDKLSPETIKRMFEVVHNDATHATHRHRAVASVLSRVYETRADATPATFNTLIGDQNAFTTVKMYIEKAQESDKDELRVWAGRHAALFGLYVEGFRGDYYAGTNFEKLVMSRLDRRILIPNLQYPYPDKRNENLSIRWTGKLRIEKAGTYTFHTATDDGQRLWIDGKMIIDDWNPHGTTWQSGNIELQPGMYDFKFEHFQGTGGGEAQVHWQPPGVKDKKPLTARHVVTSPWKGMKKASGK